MKTLYIMRHAKSSWANPHLSDKERPLINTGIKRTQKINHFLISKKVNPDLIISSDAVRAIDTAKIVADALNYKSDDIVINNKIYECDEESIFFEIYALSNDKNDVLIVGHNPTFSQLANVFLTKKIDFLPTSAVVSVSFETDSWERIETSIKRINFIAIPKKL